MVTSKNYNTLALSYHYSFLFSDAQLYEWSCSALDTDTNRYYLPDLPIADVQDVASSGRMLAITDSTLIYIYPVSPVNCTGTVSAIHFCYQTNTQQFNTEQCFFTLLTMEQTGQNFTITDVIDVCNTPSEQVCANGRICCETVPLMVPFNLPSSNFAFGISGNLSPDGDIYGLLTYLPVHMDFRRFQVEQYRPLRESFPELAVGNTYTVPEGSTLLGDRALRLLQFAIGEGSLSTFLSDYSMEFGACMPMHVYAYDGSNDIALPIQPYNLIDIIY